MLTVMLYLDWRFSLIALSIAPVLFVLVYHFMRRIKAAARDGQAQGKRARVGRAGIDLVGAPRQDVRARGVRGGPSGSREPSASVDRDAPSAQRQGRAGAAGRRRRRGRHLPRAVVRRTPRPARRTDGGRAARLRAVSREDVQADEGSLEDDRHVVEGGGRVRAGRRDPGDREQVRDLPGARRAGAFAGHIAFVARAVRLHQPTTAC